MSSFLLRCSVTPVDKEAKSWKFLKLTKHGMLHTNPQSIMSKTPAQECIRVCGTPVYIWCGLYK